MTFLNPLGVSERGIASTEFLGFGIQNVWSFSVRADSSVPVLSLRTGYDVQYRLGNPDWSTEPHGAVQTGFERVGPQSGTLGLFAGLLAATWPAVQGQTNTPADIFSSKLWGAPFESGIPAFGHPATASLLTTSNVTISSDFHSRGEWIAEYVALGLAGTDETIALPFAIGDTPPSAGLPLGEIGETAFVETHAGAVTSQGVPAMAVDVFANTFRTDGSGITIGIISDSFDTDAAASTRYLDDIAGICRQASLFSRTFPKRSRTRSMKAALWRS